MPVTGFAGVFLSVEIGLHTLSTLVQGKVVETYSRQIGQVRVWEKPWHRYLAHQSAPGWGQSDWRAKGPVHGKDQGGLNTKITAMVDRLGRLVGLGLARGNQDDAQACALHFDTVHGQWVIADKVFDTDALRHKLAVQKRMARIPPKSNRKTQYYYSEDLYKLRHKVENLFCRIKIHRCVATRYEKLAETHIGFVTIAAILDWPHRSFCRKAREIPIRIRATSYEAKRAQVVTWHGLHRSVCGVVG